MAQQTRIFTIEYVEANSAYWSSEDETTNIDIKVKLHQFDEVSDTTISSTDVYEHIQDAWNIVNSGSANVMLSIMSNTYHTVTYSESIHSYATWYLKTYGIEYSPQANTP